MMMSLEYTSRKFSFLRLHRWAWDRKLIRKSRSMLEHEIDRSISGLVESLVRNSLGKKGLRFSVDRYDEYLQIHLEELGLWLDAVLEKVEQRPEFKLTPPSQVRPWVMLHYSQGRVSQASKLVEAFEHDLALFESLAHQASALPDAPQSPFGRVLPRRSRRKQAA